MGDEVFCQRTGHWISAAEADPPVGNGEHRGGISGKLGSAATSDKGMAGTLPERVQLPRQEEVQFAAQILGISVGAAEVLVRRKAGQSLGSADVQLRPKQIKKENKDGTDSDSSSRRKRGDSRGEQRRGSPVLRSGKRGDEVRQSRSHSPRRIKTEHGGRDSKPSRDKSHGSQSPSGSKHRYVGKSRSRSKDKSRRRSRSPVKTEAESAKRRLKRSPSRSPNNKRQTTSKSQSQRSRSRTKSKERAQALSRKSKMAASESPSRCDNTAKIAYGPMLPSHSSPLKSSKKERPLRHRSPSSPSGSRRSQSPKYRPLRASAQSPERKRSTNTPNNGGHKSSFSKSPVKRRQESSSKSKPRSKSRSPVRSRNVPSNPRSPNRWRNSTSPKLRRSTGRLSRSPVARRAAASPDYRRQRSSSRTRSYERPAGVNYHPSSRPRTLSLVLRKDRINRRRSHSLSRGRQRQRRSASMSRSSSSSSSSRASPNYRPTQMNRKSPLRQRTRSGSFSSLETKPRCDRPKRSLSRSSMTHDRDTTSPNFRHRTLSDQSTMHDSSRLKNNHSKGSSVSQEKPGYNPRYRRSKSPSLSSDSFSSSPDYTPNRPSSQKRGRPARRFSESESFSSDSQEDTHRWYKGRQRSYSRSSSRSSSSSGNMGWGSPVYSGVRGGRYHSRSSSRTRSRSSDSFSPSRTYIPRYARSRSLSRERLPRRSRKMSNRSGSRSVSGERLGLKTSFWAKIGKGGSWTRDGNGYKSKEMARSSKDYETYANEKSTRSQSRDHTNVRIAAALNIKTKQSEQFDYKSEDIEMGIKSIRQRAKSETERTRKLSGAPSNQSQSSTSSNNNTGRIKAALPSVKTENPLQVKTEPEQAGGGGGGGESVKKATERKLMETLARLKQLEQQQQQQDDELRQMKDALLVKKRKVKHDAEIKLQKSGKLLRQKEQPETAMANQQLICDPGSSCVGEVGGQPGDGQQQQTGYIQPGQDGYVGYMQPVGVPQGMYIHPGPNGQWCMQQGMVVWNGPGGQMSMYYPSQDSGGNPWQQYGPFIMGQASGAGARTSPEVTASSSGPTPPSSAPPTLPPLPRSTPPLKSCKHSRDTSPSSSTGNEGVVTSSVKAEIHRSYSGDYKKGTNEDDTNEASVKMSFGTQTSTTDPPSSTKTIKDHSSLTSSPTTQDHPTLSEKASTTKNPPSSLHETSVHPASPETEDHYLTTKTAIKDHSASAKSVSTSQYHLTSADKPPNAKNPTPKQSSTSAHKQTITKDNSLSPNSSVKSKAHSSMADKPQVTKGHSLSPKTSPTAKVNFSLADKAQVTKGHPLSTKTSPTTKVHSSAADKAKVRKDHTSLPKTSPTSKAHSSVADKSKVTKEHYSSLKTSPTPKGYSSADEPQVTKDHTSLPKSSPTSRVYSTSASKPQVKKDHISSPKTSPTSKADKPKVTKEHSPLPKASPTSKAHSSAAEKPKVTNKHPSLPKASPTSKGRSSAADKPQVTKEHSSSPMTSPTSKVLSSSNNKPLVRKVLSSSLENPPLKKEHCPSAKTLLTAKVHCSSSQEILIKKKEDLTSAVKNNVKNVPTDNVKDSWKQSAYCTEESDLYPFEISNSCDLFVAGLGPYISENDLGHYFKRFGHIVSITIPSGKFRNAPKGYAFIRFKRKEAVKRIIEEGRPVIGTSKKSRHCVKGRFLCCEVGGLKASQRETLYASPRCDAHNKDALFALDVDIPEEHRQKKPRPVHNYGKAELTKGEALNLLRSNYKDSSDLETKVKQSPSNESSSTIQWPTKDYRKVGKFGKDTLVPKLQVPRFHNTSNEHHRGFSRLHISRLGKDISNHHLRQYFGRYGHIRDMRRPAMGYAFITFDNADVMMNAIMDGVLQGCHRNNEVSVHCIWGGRLIECKRRMVSKEPLGNCQVFICDLIRAITAKDLTDYFGQYGEILGIDRPKKSYCFITYANPSSVSKVIELGKVIGLGGKSWHLIKNKYVECQQKMDRSKFKPKGVNQGASVENETGGGKSDEHMEKDSYCYYCSSQSHSLADCRYLKEQRKNLLEWATRGEPRVPMDDGKDDDDSASSTGTKSSRRNNANKRKAQKGREADDEEGAPQIKRTKCKYYKERRHDERKCVLCQHLRRQSTGRQKQEDDVKGLAAEKGKMKDSKDGIEGAVKEIADDAQSNSCKEEGIAKVVAPEKESAGGSQEKDMKKDTERLWIIGDNMLVGAEEQALATGKHKCGMPDTTQISWFCNNGATLMNFPGQFRKLLQLNPSSPPTILIVHLGTIDISMFRPEENVVNVHRALDTVRELTPKCVILWSEILPRLCMLPGVTLEKMGKKRKHLNFCSVSAVHKLSDAYTVRHNFDYFRLYLPNNSLCLSSMGYDRLLRELRGGLQMAINPGRRKCYPSCEGHGNLDHGCAYCSSYKHNVHSCQRLKASRNKLYNWASQGDQTNSTGPTSTNSQQRPGGVGPETNNKSPKSSLTKKLVSTAPARSNGPNKGGGNKLQKGPVKKKMGLWGMTPTKKQFGSPTKNKKIKVSYKKSAGMFAHIKGSDELLSPDKALQNGKRSNAQTLDSEKNKTLSRPPPSQTVTIAKGIDAKLDIPSDVAPAQSFRTSTDNTDREDSSGDKSIQIEQAGTQMKDGYPFTEKLSLQGQCRQGGNADKASKSVLVDNDKPSKDGFINTEEGQNNIVVETELHKKTQIEGSQEGSESDTFVVTDEEMFVVEADALGMCQEEVVVTETANQAKDVKVVMTESPNLVVTETDMLIAYQVSEVEGDALKATQNVVVMETELCKSTKGTNEDALKATQTVAVAETAVCKSTEETHYNVITLTQNGILAETEICKSIDVNQYNALKEIKNGVVAETEICTLTEGTEYTALKATQDVIIAETEICKSAESTECDTFKATQNDVVAETDICKSTKATQHVVIAETEALTESKPQTTSHPGNAWLRYRHKTKTNTIASSFEDKKGVSKDLEESIGKDIKNVNERGGMNPANAKIMEDINNNNTQINT